MNKVGGRAEAGTTGTVRKPVSCCKISGLWIISLIIIALVSAVIYLSRKDERRAAVAKRSKYHAFVENMVPTKNPCFTPYEYVCGAYPVNYPPVNDDEIVNPLNEARLSILSRLQDGLQTQHEGESRHAFDFAKKILNHCEVATEFTSIPEAVGVEERVANIEKTRNMHELNSVMFTMGIDYLLEYSIVKPPATVWHKRTRDSKLVKVKRHSWTHLFHAVSQETAETFITNILESTGVAWPFQRLSITQFLRYILASEFFTGRRVIKCVIEKCYNLENTSGDLEAFGLDSKFVYNITRGSDALGCVLIDSFDEIRQANTQFEKNLTEHFENMKGLAFIALLIEYGTYYSADFRSTYNVYTRDRGFLREGQHKETRCLELIDRYIPLLLTRVYYLVCETFDSSIKALEHQSIAEKESVMRLLTVHISSRRWLDDETKKFLTNKVGQMWVEWGYPAWIPSAIEFDQYFPSTFPSQIQDDIKLGDLLRFRDEYYFKFHFQWPEHHDWPVSPLRLDYFDNDDCDDRSLTIYIPFGLLTERFYDTKRHEVLNFATVMSAVSHQAFRYLTASLLSRSPGVGDAVGAEFSRKVHKLISYYQTKEVTVQDKAVKLGHHIQSGQFYPAVMDATFKFIELWFVSKYPPQSEQVKLGDGRFSARTWYFLAHVSQFCSSMTSVRLVDAIENGYIPEKFIFDEILESSQHFRREFKCEGSSIRQDHPRQVWWSD